MFSTVLLLVFFSLQFFKVILPELIHLLAFVKKFSNIDIRHSMRNCAFC